MMMRILVTLFALFVTAPALAVDLLDIYRDAQLRDARFGAARAQYQAQQERLPQARAGLLPNINFDASYNYNDIDIEYSSERFDSGRRTTTALT
jgi:outer membrane protein